MSYVINNIRWENDNRTLVMSREVEGGVLYGTLSWVEPINDPEERKEKEVKSVANFDKIEMRVGEKISVRYKGPFIIKTVQGQPTWWWPRIFYMRTSKLVFGWGRICWIISRRKAKTPPTKEADGAYAKSG